jgi:hypothetical protein
MITILTDAHSTQIAELIDSKETLMSQSLEDILENTLDSRKTLLTDSIINFFTRVDNPYSIAFGKFENDKLRAIICATFSYMVPAWSTSYVISNYNSTTGAYASFELIKEVMKHAESRGYYQYYTVVEKDRAESYDKLFRLKMKTNYLTAVDENVPAHNRPINDLFWGWLYESRCKNVDTVVVNHWLPREFRK